MELVQITFFPDPQACFCSLSSDLCHVHPLAELILVDIPEQGQEHALPLLGLPGLQVPLHLQLVLANTEDSHKILRDGTVQYIVDTKLQILLYRKLNKTFHPVLRIRIQQKMKEEMNKNGISNFRPVNSGLCVLLDCSMK